MWQKFVGAHIGGVGGHAFTTKSSWPNNSFHFKGQVNEFISPEPSIRIHIKWTHGFSVPNVAMKFWCSISIKNTYFASKWIHIKFFVGTCEFVKNVIFSHDFQYVTYSFSVVDLPHVILLLHCCAVYHLIIFCCKFPFKLKKKLPKFWDRKLFFHGGYGHIHVYWLHIEVFLKKSYQLSRIVFQKTMSPVNSKSA
jgi:hypothetical protein